MRGGGRVTRLGGYGVRVPGSQAQRSSHWQECEDRRSVAGVGRACGRRLAEAVARHTSRCPGDGRADGGPARSGTVPPRFARALHQRGAGEAVQGRRDPGGDAGPRYRHDDHRIPPDALPCRYRLHRQATRLYGSRRARLHFAPQRGVRAEHLAGHQGIAQRHVGPLGPCQATRRGEGHAEVVEGKDCKSNSPSLARRANKDCQL